MYILFGCGKVGESLVQMLGESSVAYFLDNNPAKRTMSTKIPVYTFKEKVLELKCTQHELILSVSSIYEKELVKLLKEHGITKYRTYSDFLVEETRKKIEARLDYITIYKNAIKWIQKYSSGQGGIFITNNNLIPYPEVTGYYIPTLLQWGYRDLAVAYTKWLCTIQKEDGSWCDSNGNAPYVFDSAQILKGMIAVREIMPEVDVTIHCGCDWILSNMQENGRLSTPTKDAWGNQATCSELVHLYCLSPLADAGRILGEAKYEQAAQKILNYYLENYREDIENFSLLSHFYAYVMEGLIDMGREDVTRSAMQKLSVFQKEDGSVPGYNNVNWVCSTGLFQLALVWFRLGDIDRGNRAFSYACKLQNESGGWYGSYIHPDYPHEKNNYFPTSEISWAGKYFLDALYWKNVAEFDNMEDSFLPQISKDDGRYQFVRDAIKGVSRGGLNDLKFWMLVAARGDIFAI